MSDIRTLTVLFNAIDSVSETFDDVEERYEKLNEAEAIVHVMAEGTNAAYGDLEEVQSLADNIDGKVVSIESIANGQAVQNLKQQIDSVTQAQAQSNQTHTQSVSTWDKVSSAIGNASQTLEQYKNDLLMVSGVLAGFVGLTGMAAIQTEELKEATLSKVPDELRSVVEEWMENPMRGIEDEARKRSFISLSAMPGIDTNEAMKYTEMFEKYQFDPKNYARLKQEMGITSPDQLVKYIQQASYSSGGRSINRLGVMLGAKGLTGDALTAEMESVGADKNDIEARTAAIFRILQREMKNLSGGPETVAMKFQIFYATMDNLTKLIQSATIPYFQSMADTMVMLGEKLSVLEKHPGLMKLIGFTLMFISMSAGLATVVANYGRIKSAVIALSAAYKAMGLALIANPLLTAIVLIVAAVGLLLYKTGYLERAWNRFSQSAMGQDLFKFLSTIATMLDDMLTKTDEWWASWSRSPEGQQFFKMLEDAAYWAGVLFDQVDALYKSMPGTGTQKAIVMLIPGAAIGFAAMALVAKLVQTLTEQLYDLYKSASIVERVTTLIYRILQWIKNVADTIYTALVGLWRAILELPTKLNDAIDKKVKSVTNTASDATTNAISYIAPIADVADKVMPNQEQRQSGRELSQNIESDAGGHWAFYGDDSVWVSANGQEYRNPLDDPAYNAAYVENVESAATGARIIRGGLLRVHDNESVKPARISRTQDASSDSNKREYNFYATFNGWGGDKNAMRREVEGWIAKGLRQQHGF